MDLLRVLQDRTFTRLGGQQPIHTDFRVIAATHRNLEEMVKEGSFRQDLFYRLNVVTIPVPPLRERDGDIPLLAMHLLRRLSSQMSRRFEDIEVEAMERLVAHQWPGNVRELENALERAMVVGTPPIIQAKDLPLAPPGASTEAAPPPGATSLASMERMHIQRILDQHGGNVSRAARELEIDRVTLYNKIKKYDLRRG